MLPIAQLPADLATRRALTGARGTDPVLPDEPARVRRPAVRSLAGRLAPRRHRPAPTAMAAGPGARR